MKFTTRNYAACALTVFGCTGMVGDLFNNTPLKGIGAASVCAPMPKVFCDNNGLEGFASEFHILLVQENGTVEERLLTAEMYARMPGPYNRRNVYGAAFSYGPKLPTEMWQSVFQYGLGPDGTLPAEFGLPKDSQAAGIRIRTKTKGRTDSWVLSTSLFDGGNRASNLQSAGKKESHEL